MDTNLLERANELTWDIKTINNQLSLWTDDLISKQDFANIGMKTLYNSFDDKIFEVFRESVIADYKSKLISLCTEFDNL